jgi:hypothetical protein
MEVQLDPTAHLYSAEFEEPDIDPTVTLTMNELPAPIIKLAVDCGLSGAKISLAAAKMRSEANRYTNMLATNTAPPNLKIRIAGLPKHLDTADIITETERSIVRKLQQFYVLKCNALNAKLTTHLLDSMNHVRDEVLPSISQGLSNSQKALLTRYNGRSRFIQLALHEFNDRRVEFGLKMAKDKEKKLAKSIAFEAAKNARQAALIDKGTKIIDKQAGQVVAVEDQVKLLAVQLQGLQKQLSERKIQKKDSPKPKQKGKGKEKPRKNNKK